jgi:Domain of unknown function (DUF3470)/Endosomal/lysosomal potassium channel TMEM175
MLRKATPERLSTFSDGVFAVLITVLVLDLRPPELPTFKADPGLEEWLSLNAKYAKIWPNITAKKAPPADSKEWEGKPDKLQYFSPNPGAGD